MPFLLIHVLDCLAFSLFLYFFIAFRGHRRRRSLSYPPGPPSHPIIGNLLDVPNEAPWMAYAEMSKNHGTGIVLLTSPYQPETRNLHSQATFFVSAFLVKSLSCCARHQPSRIYSRSAEKFMQTGLHFRSWKCAHDGSGCFYISLLPC
jgi:hypothetical protein